MKVIAAIDVGYSNLKQAWLYVPDNVSGSSPLFKALKDLRSDNEEVRAESKLNTRIFPAGASPISELADSRSDNLMGHTVKLGDTQWRAPIDFADTQTVRRDFSGEYVKSDVWLALLKGALAEIDSPTIDTLVLGLPSSEFYKRPELKAYVEERATGPHELADKTVEVKKVVVIPQPLGTFYGQMLSCTNKEELEQLTESLVLVCDPGYYSFDFVLIQGGNRIYQDSSISTPNSVKAVCDNLRGVLKQKHQVNLQDGRIEQALRSDKTYVYAGGKKIEFSKELEEVAAEVASATLSEIRSSLHSKGYEPDIAIISGGGAKLFHKYIKDGTGVNRVDQADNPVMRNVIGYLHAAL